MIVGRSRHENCTRPLVLTSPKLCRTSENNVIFLIFTIPGKSRTSHYLKNFPALICHWCCGMRDLMLYFECFQPFPVSCYEAGMSSQFDIECLHLLPEFCSKLFCCLFLLNLYTRNVCLLQFFIWYYESKVLSCGIFSKTSATSAQDHKLRLEASFQSRASDWLGMNPVSKLTSHMIEFQDRRLESDFKCFMIFGLVVCGPVTIGPACFPTFRTQSFFISIYMYTN